MNPRSSLSPILTALYPLPAMAPYLAAVQALILVLAITSIHPSSCCMSVKGSVSCLDCSAHHDLSGLKVAVKCRNETSLMYAVTDTKGYFEATMLTNSSSTSSSSTSTLDCLAMLLGGPIQLCSLKKSMLSKLTKAQRSEDSSSYGLSTPLTFFTSCTPSKADKKPFDEEKRPAAPPTNFPPDGNYSNLPLIFFFPFLPIIGIP